MTHASLFSGIGGFDLAAEWAGWTNVFNCEIDPFCRQVLAYHFPDAIQYEDIKTTDFRPLRGQVDVLTGGFPCQPFSLAGKRRGTDDNRYLWPEMLRAIRELSPRWVVGENVFGIVNWSDGLVFEQVCADLENEGYEVQPYLIPACAVDAPHRRDRVWFVAHCAEFAKDAIGNGLQRKPRASQTNPDERKQRLLGAGGDEWVCEEEACRGWWDGHRYIPSWHRFPTQPPICGRNDGLSARLDSITFHCWRRESIKAYGNAVVPQVVLKIFETINDYERN